MSKTNKQKNRSKAPKKRSQFVAVFNRFRRNNLAMVGTVLLVVLILVAVAAPLFVDYYDAITMDIKNRNRFPSWDYPLGTDHYGRDILARIIYGARVSLAVSIATIVLSLAFGLAIGSIAGYYGGRVDNILMRIMDIFLAIPQMLMAISIVAAMGPGLINLLMAMSISLIPRFARIVRSSVLSVRGQEFIEAAKAYGTRNRTIITRHIIPNTLGPIVVQATLNVAETIIAISSLSYLGLGVKPPQPEWGAMLSVGNQVMRDYPYQVVIPGIAIVLTVMALNLMGDGLRDALDPKLKN